MTNDELLARAEKAEKELAELKANVAKAAVEIFRQQQESYSVATALAAKVKQLEDRIKNGPRWN
jgi:malate/lactate dehydrogenase